MRDKLISYLLDDLPPEERSRIEERLENDPIWKNELERLRECIKEYAADPKTASPPSDLVDRTCNFVRRNATAEKCKPTLSESNDGLTSKKRWSIVDLAVAAVILIAVGSLLLPALRVNRELARQQECQHKLYQLGLALAEYNDRFGNGIPSVEPHENAGIFVVKLAESGILTEQQLAELLVCPGSELSEDVFAGRIQIQIPSRAELNAMQAELRDQALQRMSGSFAYCLGYVDPSGKYHSVRFNRLKTAPMLADTPSFAVAGFQSANHGGCGQNFLYQDLSVRHVKLCLSSENQDVDHPYLNADRKQAAGRHANDIVLVRSEVGPKGPMVRSPKR